MEMITLTNPKLKISEYFRMGLGALLTIFGLLMMLSLVFLLPGMVTVLIGFLILYFGRPAATIKCRQCGGDVAAKMVDKQAKCEHCDTVHPIKWTKTNRQQPA